MNSLAHYSLANANGAAAPDPRKAKRRSLLPQFSRKASNDGTSGARIAEEINEDEDTNVNTTRRSGSETSRQSTDVEADSGRRRAIDEDRRAMPPPATRLSRPGSMVQPRGSSIRQAGRPAHAPSASKDKEMDVETARADSLAALTGAPSKPGSEAMGQGSGLKRTGSTRLPQSPRPGAPSIPTRTMSAKTAESNGRAAPLGTATGTRDGHARGMSTASGSSTAEKRSSTARPRPQSIIMTPPAQDAVNPPTSPPRSMLSRGRPSSHATPPSKPTFNTFQQHYSPAKQALPKPPIPSSKSMRAPPLLTEDEPVPFDVARQQIELLQLSLLHQASAQCTAEYTASAKRKLGRKHTKLRKEYESVRATELVQQRALNLAALESWCADDPAMLVENLQILSMVYSDLGGLMEEGSRHAELVKTFEDWIESCWDAAKRTELVQALPDEWHDAHSSLALKLRSVQRTLGVLRPPDKSGNGEDVSALAAVLRGCKALVDGMLKELEVMGKLEKEVLAQERERVEAEVASLVLEDVGIRRDWVPAWGRVA